MGESSLIVQRDARDRDNGTLAWMVGVDSRALALENCGCGLPLLRHLITAADVQNQRTVIEATFFHPDKLHCKMAFDCTDHYKPLTYGQYCRLMEIESDEEE